MRIPCADYVNPILEKTMLYMQLHPENFERIREKFKTIQMNNSGKKGV